MSSSTRLAGVTGTLFDGVAGTDSGADVIAAVVTNTDGVTIRLGDIDVPGETNLADVTTAEADVADTSLAAAGGLVVSSR